MNHLIKSHNIFFFFSLIIISILGFDIQPVHAQNKIAYLTFDDGPSKNTLNILSILDQYHIKGTFFLTGNRINTHNYSILKKIIANDHYIGLHTMTHDYHKLYGSQKSFDEFFNEILQEQLLIFNITGFKSTLVRAPYSDGAIITNQYIKALVNLNLKLWDWTVDSEDWRLSNSSEIINNINHDIKISPNPYLIVILFHELNITVETLPLVINDLKKQGYSFKVYDPKHHIPVNFKDNPSI